jgi:hypothetical protein
MAEIHFRPIGASNVESDVTIQFLVGGLVTSLCRNFPSILYRSKVIQESQAFPAVKKFFQVLGANMTPKIFFANLDSPKRHFLEKICVD